MAMNIDYTGIKDSIATILQTDTRFNLANTGTRYVRQILKQKWILSAPFPTILISLTSKASEQHMAIGYSPFPVLMFSIKTIIQSPPNKVDSVSEIPTALLTAIGATDIQTPELADKALEKITDAIEEVIRGNNGALNINRYLNNGQIKVALPVSTEFNFIKSENAFYLFSDIALRVEMRLTAS